METIEVNEIIREIENIFLNKNVTSNGKPYFGKLEIAYHFNNGKEVHIFKGETFRPGKVN